MQWLCEICHCFCTVHVYQVRMQKEECVWATLVWKCSHVHTENKQRQHCSWSLVHILKNESSSVLIFFSALWCLRFFFFFGLSVSLVNVRWKVLHTEERQARPSCILSHPGLILHFSCCVLLTAGVSSVQSRPFHCALCWEWWQSDDTALIKSWADFRFCVISLTQKSDLIWMRLRSLSTSNLWNKILFLYFNLLWQFCQHWTAYRCLFSCHAGLSLPENQRHVRNQKDQQRQLLGPGRGTLIKQYIYSSLISVKLQEMPQIF